MFAFVFAQTSVTPTYSLQRLSCRSNGRNTVSNRLTRHFIPDGIGPNPKPPSMSSRFSSKEWLFCLRGWPNSRILYRILPNILAIVSWTALLTYFFQVSKIKCNFPSFLHSLVGSVLSLLIVFKTNTSYDRFWEARKQWGSIIAIARSMTRFTYVYLNESNFSVVGKLLLAFCTSLKQHLRRENSGEDYESYLKASDIEHLFVKKNRPLYILRVLETQLIRMLSSKYRDLNPNLSSALSLSITDQIRSLDSAMGACERILTTPAPYFYSINTSRLLSLYLFTLPLVTIPLLHWYSLPIMFAVSWCFIAIQEIGHFIEGNGNIFDNSSL